MAGDRNCLKCKTRSINALDEIMLDIFTLKKALNDEVKITLGGLKAVCGTQFFKEGSLIKLLADKDISLLSAEAYEYLVNYKLKRLSETVEVFPDRTTVYVEIAALARTEEMAKAEEFLLKAADNLLGYGYHKDSYLLDLMEAVDFCVAIETNKEKIDGWLSRLSPVVENVTEYTDGDETGYFKLDLAELFGKYDIKLLYKNYYAQADIEELFHAEDLFRIIIRSMDYGTDTEIALGSTALDKDSFEELEKVAEDKEGAKRSLKTITDYLGEIHYIKEKSDKPPSLSDEKESDYGSVPPSLLETWIQNRPFENIWTREQFLKGWFSYWREKGEKEKVYQAMKTTLFNFGIREAPGSCWISYTLWPTNLIMIILSNFYAGLRLMTMDGRGIGPIKEKPKSGGNLLKRNTQTVIWNFLRKVFI